MATREFPLIAPLDQYGLLYQGFLTVKDEDHFITIQASPSTDGMPRTLSVHAGPELDRLLKHHDTQLLKARLGQCQDVTQLLSEIKELAERASKTETPVALRSAERYAELIRELSVIGFEKIQTMSDNMDKITLELKDAGSRMHKVCFHIPVTYPLTPVETSMDIPGADILQGKKTLTEAFAACVSLLTAHQDWFNCMDEIDQKMRVLDPDPPNRRDTWRRIALKHHCSLHLEVDPERPRSVPKEAQLFGSEKRLAAAQSLWVQGLSRWDPSQTPYTNINTILCAYCVSPHVVGTEKEANPDDVECGICYAYKLNHDVYGQQTPDVLCTGDQCSRGFHSACLYEWLRTNPTTTRSFNVLFGKCPYCSERIAIDALT